jgi:putative ABC transport system permease protein
LADAMLFLARKNLFEQPLRLSFAILGVALSVMLILVMWAILQGILGQAGAFVKNTDAQVWVVQKGFTDIAHGFSVVPASLGPRLERLPGVEAAHPITGARTEVPTGEGKESLGVIGYEAKSGVGGPWAFASDPAIPKPGQLVVDETFAKTAGLEVGEEVETPDRPREIVALSAGTNQFTNQLAFGELRDVQRLVRLREDVNFFALQVAPGAAKRVRAEIGERFQGVTAFSKPTFLANNEREIKEGFEPILYVMVGIAFFVGTAIVGLTMYTAATEKSREYGVLSAIGADRGDLGAVIVRQAAIMSAIGFALGSLLVFPADWLIGELAPKTELEYPPWLFAITAAASVVMALVASYVPVRRLASLDPAVVFRA